MSRETIIANDLTNEHMAERCAINVIPIIRDIFKSLGRVAPEIPKIVVRIGTELPEGKVGSYKVPDESHSEGIMTVHPDAFTGKKAPYWFVIAHEMIHAFLGPDSKDHKDDFYVIAKALGIPDQYTD